MMLATFQDPPALVSAKLMQRCNLRFACQNFANPLTPSLLTLFMDDPSRYETRRSAEWEPFHGRSARDACGVMQFSILAASGIGIRVFACFSQPHGKSAGTKLDEDHHFMFHRFGHFTDYVR